MGQATFKNRVTGESYELGFDLAGCETALERAWDLVSMVARLKGWRATDIHVYNARIL